MEKREHLCPKTCTPPGKPGTLPENAENRQKRGFIVFGHFWVPFFDDFHVFLVIFGTPFLRGPEIFRYGSLVICPKKGSKNGQKRGHFWSKIGQKRSFLVDLGSKK